MKKLSSLGLLFVLLCVLDPCHPSSHVPSSSNFNLSSFFLEPEHPCPSPCSARCKAAYEYPALFNFTTLINPPGVCQILYINSRLNPKVPCVYSLSLSSSGDCFNVGSLLINLTLVTTSGVTPLQAALVPVSNPRARFQLCNAQVYPGQQIQLCIQPLPMVFLEQNLYVLATLTLDNDGCLCGQKDHQ